MATYVILSRFSPEAFREPHEFKKLAEAVSAKIKSECSGIRWKDSYATLGRFDVVDVVEANDPKQIEKAAMIIRAYGHSTTEMLTATPWYGKQALTQFTGEAISGHTALHFLHGVLVVGHSDDLFASTFSGGTASELGSFSLYLLKSHLDSCSSESVLPGC